jgi:hypothetical protein
MHRRVITLISAAAIAITAIGATPARADEKDIAKALAIVLGAAVVGKVIHDRRKKEREEERARVVSRRTPPPLHSVVRPRERVHHHRREIPQPVYEEPRRPHVDTRRLPPLEPRPLPRAVDHKLLPAQCFQSQETRSGTQTVFGLECLQQNYSFVDRMPIQCLVNVRNERGFADAYEARCLRDAGYSLARG